LPLDTRTPPRDTLETVTPLLAVKPVPVTDTAWLDSAVEGVTVTVGVPPRGAASDGRGESPAPASARSSAAVTIKRRGKAQQNFMIIISLAAAFPAARG